MKNVPVGINEETEKEHMRKNKKVSTEVEVLICDFCSIESYKIKSCIGCGKDICQSCATFWFYDPWTGEDNGDSPQWVCSSCNEKVFPFAEQVQKIQAEADEKIDILVAQWETECKKKGDIK